MMLPRFALTLSVAVQVLLVFHSSIASFPVVVGATTTTSSINKEGEDTTSTSVLRPGRRGLKKSSQEVASSTAFGASDNEQHHILKKKEASKVVLSNAADQTMREDVVLGDKHDYPPPEKIKMIDVYDDKKDIREDIDSDENFASELPDMTLPTKNAGITTRQLNQIGQKVVVYDAYVGDWGVRYGSGTGNWAACGVELRVEWRQANGIRFRFCGLHNGINWNNQGTIEPALGKRGDWRGMEMCSKNEYIGAVKVKYGRVHGNNHDTALKGLKIWCVNKNWISGHTIPVFDAGYMLGEWKDWKYVWGRFVNLVRVRFDDVSGNAYSNSFDGDKGINGIVLWLK